MSLKSPLVWWNVASSACTISPIWLTTACYPGSNMVDCQSGPHPPTTPQQQPSLQPHQDGIFWQNIHNRYPMSHPHGWHVSDKHSVHSWLGTHIRNPMSHPHGWDMRFLLCVPGLLCVGCLSLTCSMCSIQYDIMLHHVIQRTPVPSLNIKMVFPSMGISIIVIRWSWDRLIFIMGIPILVRWHHYIETAPSIQ